MPILGIFQNKKAVLHKVKRLFYQSDKEIISCLLI
jgi:hypothetical protein